MPTLDKPKTDSKKFLKMAKDHLELAECAYKTKNYSDTISLLAQSVELASKSFLFNSGTISNSDFSVVGHLPTKGFEKSIDKIDMGFQTIKENFDQIHLSETEKIPEFNINSVHSHRIQAKKTMSTISTNPKQFKNIPKKNMQNILSTIQNLQNQLEKSQNKIIADPNYLKNSDDFRKDVFNILDCQKMSKALIQMFKYHSTVFYATLEDTLGIKDKAIVYHSIINVTVTFGLLAIVTQSHAISSRYNIYNDTHLLIKNFPQIKAEMTKALEDLETFYKISERSQNFEST